MSVDIYKINPEFKKKGVAGSGMSTEESAAIIESVKKYGKQKKFDKIFKNKIFIFYNYFIWCCYCYLFSL